MKLTDKTKWLTWRIDAAGAVFCVAVSLVAYFAAFSPLMRRHTAFARQQEELAIQRRVAGQLAAPATLFKKELLSLRQVLAESRIQLQPTDRVNRQIAELTELINESGLKANDIQLGEIFDGAKYDVVPINLAGSGRYTGCAAFLNKLSDTFPDTGVASFEISGDPQKPKDPGRFQFGLFWYATSAAGPRGR